MCDLGEAKGLHEVTPSLYGFVNEQGATNAKKNALVGCLRIIFC